MPTSTYWKMWDGMRRGEWENRAVFLLREQENK